MSFTSKQARRLKWALGVSFAAFAVAGLVFATERSGDIYSPTTLLPLVIVPAGIIFAFLTFRAAWVIWGWTGLVLNGMALGVAAWLVPMLFDTFTVAQGGDTGRAVGAGAQIVLTVAWIWLLARRISSVTAGDGQGSPSRPSNPTP